MEVAFPRLLFATHRYTPSSALLTFVIVKFLFSASKLILESPLLLIMVASLVHDIVGTGSPLTLQDKVTVSPSIFVALCGCFVISGGTASRKKTSYLLLVR